MKRLILAALLLAGCQGLTFIRALDSGQGLSSDQIKALKENNQDVYGCFQIGGPPPSGNMVWIIVPKGSPVNFRFSDNCHIFQ